MGPVVNTMYRTFQEGKKRSTFLISWQRQEAVRQTSLLRVILFLVLFLSMFFVTHWQRGVAANVSSLKRQHRAYSALVEEERGSRTFEVVAQATKVMSGTAPRAPRWNSVGSVAAAAGVPASDAVNAQRPLIEWAANRLYPSLSVAATIALGIRGSDGRVTPVANFASRDSRPQVDLSLVGFKQVPEAEAEPFDDDDSEGTPASERSHRHRPPSKEPPVEVPPGAGPY